MYKLNKLNDIAIKYKNGDKSVRNELIELSLSRVLPLTDKFDIAKEDKEDLYQDIALTVIECIEDFVTLEVNSFAAFLERKTEHLIKRYQEELERKSMFVSYNGLKPTHSAPELEYEYKLFIRGFNNALAKISPHRAIPLLYYYGIVDDKEWDIKEIYTKLYNKKRRRLSKETHKAIKFQLFLTTQSLGDNACGIGKRGTITPYITDMGYAMMRYKHLGSCISVPSRQYAGHKNKNNK